MKKKEYNIVFSSLKLGQHTFEYEIDQSFLDILFDYHDMPGVKAVVSVVLNKQNTMLEMHFAMKGILPAHCDLTNKPYDQPIQNEFEFVVKFGEAYNDEDDELLILPHGEYEINVAQYIYELLVLSLPTKFIHPDIDSGNLDDDSLELLERYAPQNTDVEEDDDDDEIDPRWSKLKDLLN